MINSRDLADLEPDTRQRAEAHLAACKAAGIDVIVTSTYRDADAQAALYAQGRTEPGRIVTNAKPGQSWHNWRRAYDVVPLRAGKAVWSTKGADGDLWEKIGLLGEQNGLEWAGRWRKFREFPHFQWTAGFTLLDMATEALRSKS